MYFDRLIEIGHEIEESVSDPEIREEAEQAFTDACHEAGYIFGVDVEVVRDEFTCAFWESSNC